MTHIGCEIRLRGDEDAERERGGRKECDCRVAAEAAVFGEPQQDVGTDDDDRDRHLHRCPAERDRNAERAVADMRETVADHRAALQHKAHAEQRGTEAHGNARDQRRQQHRRNEFRRENRRKIGHDALPSSRALRCASQLQSAL